MYEPYSTPKEWNVPLYSEDMRQIVNCASCGKEIYYGDTYTSKTIHNAVGLGYPVCEACYEHEWAEKEAFENGNKRHSSGT